ncbi:MAG: methylmalonyl-CoA carboxyltransferase [Spirochaetia bacterium]|nr:methylmalonyl-CoA carboxyltransferase [Spirochaetia bacterium]
MGTVELERLKARKEQLLEAGGSERVTRQHEQGKYTARERLERFFDPGSFMEIGAFAVHQSVDFGMDAKEIPYDAVITGFGTVDDRPVYAFAQDYTIMGGSLGKMHAQKILNIMQLALKTGSPIVGLNDSGGARIQEGVDSMSGYGSIFHQNAVSSGVIPQISVIMGPCAGGASYSPALTDFIFMVKGTGKMFLTGPDVIKTVTGEEVTAEALGGAQTHNEVSGVAHFLCDDEQSCLEQVRTLLSYLPSNNMDDPPAGERTADPMRSIAELDTIIPDQSQRSYDMKQVIGAIADGGTFFEVSAGYAKNIITGFIHISGRSVGVVANQPKVMAGCMDINASDKASRFIRICNAYNLPLLNLVDVPGFLPGTGQEYGGVIRHGAKMLYAYSEATVPKVTVILRKAFGGSYLGMCSKELGADMVLAWPTAEIAVMGAQGAASIIFRKEIDGAKDPQKEQQQRIESYREQFLNPYVAAGKNYIDDVIIPSQTRSALIRIFDQLSQKRETLPPKKHGLMPV